MKFNKATSKLLSEMDTSSVMGTRRNNNTLGGDDGEGMRIRIMKNMGADDQTISRWKAAKAKGITFESFLLGLVDELKNKKVDYAGDDDSSFE